MTELSIVLSLFKAAHRHVVWVYGHVCTWLYTPYIVPFGLICTAVLINFSTRKYKVVLPRRSSVSCLRRSIDGVLVFVDSELSV